MLNVVGLLIWPVLCLAAICGITYLLIKYFKKTKILKPLR
jgi:uncharacterized iron-regulated membrane protein